MKTLIVLFLSFLSLNLLAQDEVQQKMFSNFKLGALAGINVSELTGSSIIIEAKNNLFTNLNLKLSAGYSTLNKKEGYNVKTYRYVNFDNYQKYSTESYDLNEINYDVFPISVGLEYFFLKDNFSPYSVFEIGYNLYSYKTTISNSKSGFGGVYDTFEELPTEYKSKAPAIPDDNSYRIALGVGTNYRLSSAINLDVRYVYQINKSLVNTNQFLVGINF